MIIGNKTIILWGYSTNVKVNDKNVAKSLIKIKQELDCATNGKSDGYIKLKIEKAISMIDVLMDIVEFE